jgi:hypothetical protein
VDYKYRSVIADVNSLVQSTAADTTFHKNFRNIFSYIFEVPKPCGGRELTAPFILNRGSKSR